MPSPLPHFAILARLLAKALARLKKLRRRRGAASTSNGHHTFRGDGPLVDLDAIVAGLEVGRRHFRGVRAYSPFVEI